LNSPRAIALQILNQANSKRQPADAPLSKAFESEHHLTRLDRAFIAELVYGVLRWRGRIDWIIKQFSAHRSKEIHPSLLNILRMGVYQIFFLTKVPDSAAVNESVNLAKMSQPLKNVSFVNGLLRGVARERQRVVFPDKNVDLIGYITTFYSHPQWMVSKWLDEFGVEETISICEANNKIPPLTIRTNTLRIKREGLIKRLSHEVSFTSPTLFSPEGLYLRDILVPLTEIEAYKNGLFTIQDEASQLVAHIADPKPGEKILDACAGLGGKTTHLAQLMANKGEIWAWDNNGSRLSMLKQTADRLGIQIIKIKRRDVLKTHTESEYGTYHRILADAPCSGLGTIRRNPDIKWNKKREDPARLYGLQLQILKNLVPLLEKNGVMIYATCTMAKEENEEVIASFLKTYPNFIVEDILPVLGKTCRDLIQPSGFFQTYPHRHEMDGFFAARLRKAK
jgi:16S rRNA (cytosine967-C5)-methyltransferase